MSDGDQGAGKSSEERSGFGQDSTTERDKNLHGNTQESLNDRLDEALEETFPTSDPVSVKITK